MIPLSRLERLKRSILRLWRVYIVANACARCDEYGRQEPGTRYVEVAAWRSAVDLWLCVACARALGVPAPNRDDR